MDLNEIKNRLERLNNPGGGKKSDFKQNFWRPQEGVKSQIRIEEIKKKHSK